MADVFGRVDQQYGGGLSADALIMKFPELDVAGQGVGLLIQNVQLSYRQEVRRIYELGPGNGGVQYTYYIAGRPQGDAGLGRIFGMRSIDAAFYSQYGDPCNQNSIELTANDTCDSRAGNGASIAITMNGFLITGFTMGADAGEMVVREQTSAMFIGMTMTEEGTNPSFVGVLDGL